MGNTLPCMCNEARVVHATVAGAKKVKRKERLAAAKNVVDDREDQDRGDDEGVEKRPAWPRCHMQEVAVGEDGAVRLKVVMTRKDAAEFMARLEERAAAERKARTGCLSHGGAVTGPCRDAWRPRLATIQENC
ncbi:hypothetical protein CFC21_013640 [Triticum aestivum]|uniref:Uncharacterized protein n=2 Tax=Triticum aestivum TaxID=4565 RepID=A0A9R1DT35_WHEAT|nr:hypothetical protein CFC21_013640 [Triticum aestivum]